MNKLKVPIFLGLFDNNGNPIYKNTVETYYNIDDFPYDKLNFEICVKREKRQNIQYYNIPAAFDIETTTIEKKGYMYHWQFCIDRYVCFGRRWEEFVIFLNRVQESLNLNGGTRRLAVYVHSLDFELSFMHRFLNIRKYFFRDKHKPLYVLDDRGFEFRCSYFLSNMSLAKFCENSEGCIHYKLNGDDYDYKKIRTPDTKMFQFELAYCFNDVYGLCECIRALLNDDTIATLPLTSTGFVRRDVRNAVKNNIKNWDLFKKSKLTPHIYEFCVDAFRGGNTHANRFFSGYKIGTKKNPVYSYDIASSYPAVMMTEKFPMGKFRKTQPADFDELMAYCDKYCCLIDVTFFYLFVNDENPVPYIPLSKTYEHSENIRIDNGRVMESDLVSMKLTEIDLKIILETYTMYGLKINEFYFADKGYLPEEIRYKILEFFSNKTTLKNIDEYLYMKSKNKLNGIFGMMVSKLIHERIIYMNGEYLDSNEPIDAEKCLNDYYNNFNNFLCYQWGVWITAYARARLQGMINIVGPYLIYTDTDSIKFIGKHLIAEFENKNLELRKKAENASIPAWIEFGGKKIYLGVWERENDMYDFKTLGAKKYCYNLCADDSFHITVAGMNKKKGAKAIKNADNFEIGRTFHDIGRTVSYYHNDSIHTETIDNCTFTTAGGIGVVDTTYTLGVSDEYFEVILDNIYLDSDISDIIKKKMFHVNH